MGTTCQKFVLSSVVVTLVSVLLNCGGPASVQPLQSTSVTTAAITTTQNPLVAQFAYVSATQASVAVEFGTDTTYGRQTSAQTTPAGGGQVSILVAGMKPATTYHMRAVLTYPNGSQAVSADQTFTTGSVPANRLSQVAVSGSSERPASGGVELLDLFSGSATQFRAEALDLDGSLIWYYDFPISNDEMPFPIKPLANGHFLITITPQTQNGKGVGGTLREIDLAGNTIRQITIDQLNARLSSGGFNVVATSMHHDVIALPNGHWVVLVDDERPFTMLQGYEGQTINVMGDDIVDLDGNLNPVWVWSAFDHLDVNRHPMYFPPDWTHANAVIYSPDDGNLLLSMRHQHWVIKIDYQDGKGAGDIIWRLGYQGDFTIDTGNPADWYYGQHAPIFLGSNTTNVFDLALFDNGNNRVLDQNGTICGASGAPACYSRAAIFEISEATKVVHILWEDKPLEFSQAVGDNIELTNGDMEFDMGALGTNPFNAQVTEVTHEAVPQIVWQMNITGQGAYRAFRIPSLYPGVQW